MDQSDYRSEIIALKEKLAKKRREEIKHLDTRLNTEEKESVEALNKVWAIKNNEPPPVIEDGQLIEQNDKPINSGDNSKESKDSVSQNQKLRDIIAGYKPDTEITSNSVFESFQNQYPELAFGLAGKKTLISKILREMKRAGQLEKIDGIQGDYPVTYRKL